MFQYEKKLQYPVKITTPNAKLAKIIASQYGGPHGEIGASLRYLSQRYTMPYPELKAVLTDIGTEGSEMLHLEDNRKDKPFPGVLIHTVRSKSEIVRYSKNNQFNINNASKLKKSPHEKCIRIFI